MKYPLQHWDHFIYVTLHPQFLIKEINQENYTPSIWSDALSGDINVKMSLLQQVALAKKKSETSACITATHIGCINLAQTLSGYIAEMKSLPEIKELHQQTVSNYLALQNKVYEVLNFIEENFAPYCALLPRPSAPMRQCSRNTLAVRFAKCKKALQERFVDATLLKITLSSADNFFNTSTLGISNYPQFLYFGEYVWHLEKMLSSLHEDDISHKLTQILLLLNYNKFSFVRYLMQNFRYAVNEIDSIDEKIKQWHCYLKNFKQLEHLPGLALFPDAPSLKKMMVSNIKEEINFLKTLFHNKFSSTSASNVFQSQEERLTTCLSVAQLAVFVRLLVDENVIQAKNQSALLRKIADCVQTPKTVSISEDSLRTKYYTPQHASVVIMKEYLLRMMNRLRTY